MLPESKSRLVAERLLLLTEALFDAVANDRLDEIGGILHSRQSAISELSMLPLDSLSIALLEKVQESEEAVLSVMERTSAATSHELVTMFSSSRQVRAYRAPQQKGFARAG